jgi:hypothetical protein
MLLSALEVPERWWLADMGGALPVQRIRYPGPVCSVPITSHEFCLLLSYWLQHGVMHDGRCRRRVSVVLSRHVGTYLPITATSNHLVHSLPILPFKVIAPSERFLTSCLSCLGWHWELKWLTAEPGSSNEINLGSEETVAEFPLKYRNLTRSVPRHLLGLSPRVLSRLEIVPLSSSKVSYQNWKCHTKRGR